MLRTEFKMWMGIFWANPKDVARLALAQAEAVGLGGLITVIAAVTRSRLREGSWLCIEVTIAYLSVAAALQRTLGFSQGTIADAAFASEQPPIVVAAIDVRGAAMLIQIVPSMNKSAKLRINLADFCRMMIKCCLVS